jgi:uncharacterized protein (DUF697 family)
MNQEERIALLTLALVAVFANGPKDERELHQLRRVLEELSGPAGANLSLQLQDVQLKRRSARDAIAALKHPEARQLAYETAVCVCDVDGVHSDAEHRFLEDVRIALALDVRSARSFERMASAIADASLQPDPVRGFPPPVDAAGSQALDAGIVEVAAFGASLARAGTSLNLLALIPLQMKMIYRVAKAYDARRERGQVKDLMTQLGVAALPQHLQVFGLFLLEGAPRAEAAAFANTYALGHAAKSIYSASYGGEEESAPAALAEHFEALQTEGRALYATQAYAIEQQARILAANELIVLLRQQ